MALISTVGRRSASVRLLLAGMYLMLVIGAFTMVYPFALMISTATTSGADVDEFVLMPRYWRSDLALFKKYLVDAASVEELAVWFGQDSWFLPHDIREGQLEAITSIDNQVRAAIAADWHHFVTEICPDEFKMPLFTMGGRENPLALRLEYLDWLKERYGDLDGVNRAYLDNAVEWEELNMPKELLHRRPGDSLRIRDWRRFVANREPDRTGLLNVDAYVHHFLVSEYGSTQRLRQQTGLTTDSLTAVTFNDLLGSRMGEEAKRQFFFRYAPLRFARINAAKARPAWRQFLRQAGVDEGLALDERMPRDYARAATWARFVQKSAPLDELDMARPDTQWRAFLARRYGTIDALNRAHGTCHRRFEDTRMSSALTVVHYEAFRQQRTWLRWTYLTHNFVTVFKFIAVHGKALWVTIIYIVLMIGTTLTVNPLAAYALSRFRLKETHHVLVFLLATMAFPSEVLMIPGFLLIKSFPLAQLMLVGLCAAIFVLLRARLGRKLPLVPSATVALLITGALAGIVLPRLAAHYDVKLSVSLMNSFWALVLPSLANGYGIFLLKGFFDSLPSELYEAGVIDGAGEMRMFWRIALPLCKPIMAVMALGAFTAAYGAFMHAFLVCQDPKMWTLMVFLYEFQQRHTTPLVMASLVIAAIPTLIVFLFCQNIILRGIIIPSFK